MRILVCPPDYFDVDYVINPWMEGHVGRVDLARAKTQWAALFEDVATTATIEEVAPQPGSPDMCFTANAGLALSGRVVPARFRMSERAGEEAPFAHWFGEAGFKVVPSPTPDPFEGEGDALFQPGEALLWAGYGVRTALETHIALARFFEVEVLSLRLIDQRFYHLDTCLVPLPGGRVMYFPEAFDAASRATIEARIPRDRRLEISEDDATRFACNVLRVEDRLFLNHASAPLRAALGEWGFETRLHPVDEFMKAGGGVKCLSLLLDQPAFDREEAVRPSPIRAMRLDLSGHLLDDGLLRRALDVVTEGGGSFRVDTLDLAERKDQKSRCQLRVVAPSQRRLDALVKGLTDLGAEPAELDFPDTP
jgi:N-dimethylarginine dimethylaminohydrolase